MKALLVAPLILLTAATVQGDSDWQAWQRGLRHACPGRHVEWMGDSGTDAFLAAFDASLSVRNRARLAKAADLPRRCASERIGFNCEMIGTVAAARRIGLLDTMIAFACRAVQCEEGAMCSRMPQPPR